jgi:hypothetical protein
LIWGVWGEIFVDRVEVHTWIHVSQLQLDVAIIIIIIIIIITIEKKQNPLKESICHNKLSVC